MYGTFLCTNNKFTSLNGSFIPVDYYLSFLKQAYMHRFLLILLFSIFSLNCFSQAETYLNADFKPTTADKARYLAITENKNNKWHRYVYNMYQKSLEMQGWYNDEACTIADSLQVWYHDNNAVKTIHYFKNGKLDGNTFQFHDNGMMEDSITYVNGYRKGISIGWDKEGNFKDSTNFDGNGNGVQVSFYNGGEGKVYSAGRWIQDTTKNGIWNYYHKNGKIMAKEMYKNGQRESCNCFTESGEAIADELCIEKEADFAGGQTAWGRFLSKNLNPNVPVLKGAPAGRYTVMSRFVVNSDGTLSDIKIITDPGFGMGAELIRILKKSPKWVPAQQFGRNLKAYRKQPLTFVVENQ